VAQTVRTTRPRSPGWAAASVASRSATGFNVFVATCPSRQLLDRLSDKWVGLVICSLEGGSRRDIEISREVAGVSQKMLTQTLRRLERDGLVEREVTPSVPVRVDYQLTGLGRSLLPVMSAVHTWAEQHMPEVTSAREVYDRAP
jgi:DNA-binding HxlR family transcriptional regulator